MATAFTAVAMAVAQAAISAPRIPASDDTILEQLPLALLAARSVQTQPEQETGKTDLDRALATARKYIEVGQTYSDPRAYGYAQAALGKWWDADPAPSQVLVMRARILQFRHEFKPAIAQLEAALKSDEFEPDAWLLFATIEQVQGNVAASRSACLKLIPMADPLVGATCVASTAAMTNRARSAESLLTTALNQPTATTASERTWAWTILAEIRGRLGPDEDAAAEAAFVQALKLDPHDVYARAAYADFMLDRQRAGDVRKMLGDATQADALLLRAAIAAKRNGDADAGALREALASRFAEARQRGDETHLREQARFALDVQGDAAHALELAVRNFQIQREPADARILLDAAIARNDPAAARPVLDWLTDTGIDAPHLQALAAQLTQAKQG